MSFPLKSSVPARLRRSEFADALPKVELRRLDQIATLLDVPAGRRIITEATPGHECFVIVDGKFAVNGSDVETAVGAGEVAGELALLTGRNRNASVVAIGDSTVYVMQPREFSTLMSDAPQFCRQVVSSASERLGTEHVALPKQFLRKSHTSTATRPWSDQLAELPRWSSL